MSFVVDLIAMVLGMPRALFPQIASVNFGGPVEGGTTMALLAAAMSAGAVLGRVFSGWLPRITRQGLAVVAAIVVWGWPWSASGSPSPTPVAMPPGAGVALAFLAVGAPQTWSRRRFVRPCCSRPPPTRSGAGCRGVHRDRGRRPKACRCRARRRRAVVGTAAAATGGGALVVLGVLLAALAAPAFLHYRRPPTVGNDPCRITDRRYPAPGGRAGPEPTTFSYTRSICSAE